MMDDGTRKVGEGMDDGIGNYDNIRKSIWEG